MDYDISKWLKDELGLAQMSEIDINGLMFHPRHGTLCRRFVNFLAESTLCKQRYSDVLAKQSYTSRLEEYQTKKKELHSITKNVRSVSQDLDDKKRELEFLHLKLDYLVKIDLMRKTCIDAFRDIADQPKLGLEKVVREINQFDWHTDVENVTSFSNETELDDPTTSYTTRQMSNIDETLKICIENLNTLFTDIPYITSQIIDKIQKEAYKLSLKVIDFEKLVALHEPKFEELVIEENEQEKALKEMNVALTEKVISLDQQVAELKKQYELRSAEIFNSRKDQMKSCLSSWGKLQKLEELYARR